MGPSTRPAKPGQNKKAAANRKGEIHHPQKGGKAYHNHFAAFGLADQLAEVSGIVIGDTTGTKVSGKLIYFERSLLTPTRWFWILRFYIDPVTDKTYTLHVFDDSDGHEMDSQAGILVPQMKPRMTAGGLQISYPPDNATNIPCEFGSYGQTGQSGAVNGTISNTGAGTFIAQENASATPPNWYLYCAVVTPHPPCVLNVTQGPASASVTIKSFTC